MYLTAKAGDALSPHQATLLVNRENAVFLDIRDKKAFDGGHIVDAINIPSAKLKDRMVELKNTGISLLWWFARWDTSPVKRSKRSRKMALVL